MYQDRSGENAATAPVPKGISSNEDVSQIMLLTLVGSSESQNEWQLAPLAESYEEALQLALIAFHERLPEDVEEKDIILKYHLKRSETSSGWAGLVTARESVKIWRRIMSAGSIMPEIGVFLASSTGQNRSQLGGLDNFGPDEPRPQMQFNIYTSNWGGTGILINTPATYEECFEKACEIFKNHGTPRPPSGISQKDLEKLVRVRIWDATKNPALEFLDLKPSEYKSMINRYIWRVDSDSNRVIIGVSGF